MAESTFKTKYDGKDKEIVLKYNVLLKCADLHKDVITGEDPEGAVSFSKQKEILSYVLGKIDADGNITEPVDMSKLEIEDGLEIVCWVIDNVNDFFTKYNTRVQKAVLNQLKETQKQGNQLEEQLQSGLKD